MLKAFNTPVGTVLRRALLQKKTFLLEPLVAFLQSSHRRKIPTIQYVLYECDSNLTLKNFNAKPICMVNVLLKSHTHSLVHIPGMPWEAVTCWREGEHLVAAQTEGTGDQHQTLCGYHENP